MSKRVRRILEGSAVIHLAVKSTDETSSELRGLKSVFDKVDQHWIRYDA
jgi:hypothetical protein